MHILYLRVFLRAKVTIIYFSDDLTQTSLIFSVNLLSFQFCCFNLVLVFSFCDQPQPPLPHDTTTVTCASVENDNLFFLFQAVCISVCMYMYVCIHAYISV